MQFFLTLPLLFVRFWFIQAPISLVAFFVSLNSATNQLFSLTLLIKTFFKPWKNEYRKGLVGFSIFMGIIVKSCIIFADCIVFTVLLLSEFVILILFIVLPFLSLALLFLR